jgi:hypothetical protein
MFQQIQLGEKPNHDFHVYSSYRTAHQNDQLIAEAWDGRSLPDNSLGYDTHLTSNEYHAVYKTTAGEYNIYSFTNIGYIPAIPVSEEKLERAHAAEPARIHMEHCGWSGGGEPLEKAVQCWNGIIEGLARRSAPMSV